MTCRLFGAKPLPESMLAYFHLDAWKHISVNIELECYHFHSRKCNWGCLLPNLWVAKLTDSFFSCWVIWKDPVYVTIYAHPRQVATWTKSYFPPNAASFHCLDRCIVPGSQTQTVCISLNLLSIHYSFLRSGDLQCRSIFLILWINTAGCEFNSTIVCWDTAP